MDRQFTQWRADFETSVAAIHEGFDRLAKEQVALKEQQANLFAAAAEQRQSILDRQQEILDRIDRMERIFDEAQLYIAGSTGAIDSMRDALREQAAAQRDLTRVVRQALGVGAVVEGVVREQGR